MWVALAVLNSISMPSKRPKKCFVNVHRVRRRGRAGYHGHYGHRVRTDSIEGHPAAFLSAGLWFSKGHLGSL